MFEIGDRVYWMNPTAGYMPVVRFATVEAFVNDDTMTLQEEDYIMYDGNIGRMTRVAYRKSNGDWIPFEDGYRDKHLDKLQLWSRKVGAVGRD